MILHEGLKLFVYKCPADVDTIGVGRNLEARGLTDHEQRIILGKSGYSKEQVICILKDRGISREEALFLLDGDINDCIADLMKFSWYEDLDLVRWKVVVDMRLNLGGAGFRGFRKMILAIEKKDYETAAKEMVDSKWYHEVGNRSKRLVEMMRTGLDYK